MRNELLIVGFDDSSNYWLGSVDAPFWILGVPGFLHQWRTNPLESGRVKSLMGISFIHSTQPYCEIICNTSGLSVAPRSGDLSISFIID